MNAVYPHFWHLFLRQMLRLGSGVAARFAKAPAGIVISLSETKGFSAKRGGRPPASARPHGKTAASWFREARRCPRAPGGWNLLISLYFLKVKEGKHNGRPLQAHPETRTG